MADIFMQTTRLRLRGHGASQRLHQRRHHDVHVRPVAVLLEGIEAQPVAPAAQPAPAWQQQHEMSGGRAAWQGTSSKGCHTAKAEGCKGCWQWNATLDTDQRSPAEAHPSSRRGDTAMERPASTAALKHTPIDFWK